MMLAIFTKLAEELTQNMVKFHQGKHRHDHDDLKGGSFVLYYLSRHEGAVPTEISDAIGVSTARMAAALNNLEEKGFITREIDKEDRRKIIVKLTVAGHGVVEQQAKDRLNHFAVMLEKLGEHDAREYVRIMGRLAEVKRND